MTAPCTSPSIAPCPLIPLPLHYEEVGSAVTLAPHATIGWEGEDARACALLLADYLRPATGFALPVQPLAEAPAAALRLRQTGSAACDAHGFCSESYTLTTTEGIVTIQAESGAGLARGIQTLRQLLPAAIFSALPVSAAWTIPGVCIQDAPALRWRGLHLDVSRHFFSVAEVCRFLDLLALHRMNVLHWHLTDDQGWRIEIQRYPKLTEVGAVRAETLIGHHSTRPHRYDGTPCAGFYTQDEIRQVVAYAAARHITVVPEIDLPGHMQAAIAAYPELGNLPMTLSPRCHWGISQHILNAEESTVQFLCHVLDEVMTLFPGRYLHIGGDEALKREWEESKRIQELMIERGLHDEHELQSWLIGRVVRHIQSRGRSAIGWDEILEGGLADGAAVMSWRGEEGGIAAARAKHPVVFAPQSHTYFDHYQDEPANGEPLAIGGLTTVSKVYSYTPVPPALQGELAEYVLGAQGQLWAEYIPDLPHLEYMAYPRACALAETLWLPAAQKDYPDFLRRLRLHRTRLQTLGVHACPRP